MPLKPVLAKEPGFMIIRIGHRSRKIRPHETRAIFAALVDLDHGSYRFLGAGWDVRWLASHRLNLIARIFTVRFAKLDFRCDISLPRIVQPSPRNRPSPTG
jgi:hypothetical protein